MKAIKFFIFITGFVPAIIFAQAPNFRTANGFALFTSQGAVTNTSVSTIAGNVGTNLGAISGFEPPSIVNGNFYIVDDTTMQAALDLLTAYGELINAPATIIDHPAAFGAETITSGVYQIGGAGSVDGTLTLNAEGNANAVFIFKFGGAFTVGAGSEVILANGALAGNVYWVAEGAISMAANIIMKGNTIAHNAAISLGANSKLEGRMYSTNGAVSINNNVITKLSGGGYVPVSIQLLSFTGVCANQNNVLNWSTATETNNKYFTIERSENEIHWEIITKVDGAINSSIVRNYRFTDTLNLKRNYYYRLKQTDLDGVFKYGHTIYIKNCGNTDVENLNVYPNPSYGKVEILYDGNVSLVKLTQVFNSAGKKVFEAKKLQSSIDLSANASGLYYVKVHTNTAIIIKPILIKKY